MATLPDFVEAIVAEFPELRTEVEWFPGLPYVQITSLANLAQRAKRAHDWDTYRRVAEFIDRYITDPNPDLSNAIHVSVLEHLDFVGRRGLRAWNLVPPNVQLGWRRIMEYNEELLGNPETRAGSSRGSSRRCFRSSTLAASIA